MVSAQVKGIVRFYRQKSNGSMVFIYGSNLASLGPSGSSEGSIASTPDQWVKIPRQIGEKVLDVNDLLVATLEVNVSATTDASDGEAVIGITYGDGTEDTIGPFDDSTEWDVQQLGDTAFVAGQETIIAKKTMRRRTAFGSMIQPTFVSVEDNA